jgi:hypothetical protein
MSVGYTSTALDYTAPIPRYTALGDGRFVKHHPVNSISNAHTINFNIPPTDDYIDLQECFIDLKLKITKNNDEILDEGSAVAFADNIPFSVFKTVLVFLNNEQITQSTVYQTYANYFATRFGVGRNGTNIHLQHIQGLTGESAGNNDLKNNQATGWTIRKGWTNLSKEAHFRTQVPADFFRSCSQFLPPQQDLRIEMKLHEPEFALVSDDVAYKFKITEIAFYTRQVEVDASTTMAILKHQAMTPLMMNYTTLSVQSFTIPQGKKVEYIRGIFQHQTPHQLFMILVETDRINGVRTKDPFKFENGRVEKVILRQNGIPVMAEAQNTQFLAGNTQDAVEAYHYVCQAFDVGHNGRDVNLTYEQYINGATIWAWTLSPDMDGNNGVTLTQKPGNFEVDIYVSNEKENPGLTALFFGKVCKSVHIAKENQVTVV